MKRSSLLVFDDYVHVASGVATTSQQFNTALAKTDQLAIQAVVDNLTGGPAAGFKVQIFHSTDARNWIARSLSASPVGDILPATNLVAGSYFGYDNGQKPMLAYVQLQITMPALMGAHVRIYATGRDWGH